MVLVYATKRGYMSANRAKNLFFFMKKQPKKPFFLPFSPFAERFAGSRGTARSVRKIPNVFPNRFLQV